MPAGGRRRLTKDQFVAPVWGAGCGLARNTAGARSGTGLRRSGRVGGLDQAAAIVCCREVAGDWISYTELPKNLTESAMNPWIAVPLLLLAAWMGGCAEMGSPGGTKYGETSGAVTSPSERNGTIARLETIQVDDNYKLGLGTAVGAVAGGLLGAGVGDTKAAVAGAVLGGAAGTYAESKLARKDAQRITVDMQTGGRVTIVQPVDARLREGMRVRVDGSGENARVVPR